MENRSFKKSICPTSSNPIKASEEIKRFLKKSDAENFEVDLSNLNMIDAAKVLVLTSSYLYKKAPEEKLKFKFISSDIKVLLSGFSLANLEMV